jgi:two-component system response regulator PhoP
VRILIVEDDGVIAQQLREALTRTGYSVDVAADGQEGLFLGSNYPYDVALIDLGLPKLDGSNLILQLRKRRCLYPILILTARDAWQEKVTALDAGADDYVVKPFHLPEVLARIQVLIRRSHGLAQSDIQRGPLRLNMSKQTFWLHDQELVLTAYEYRVLEYLVLHPGQVVSKTELTEHIYDQDFDRDSNTLEVFIRRLRKKIDPDETLNPIETLRGRGYRFAL